jgi:hypothetical protein
MVFDPPPLFAIIYFCFLQKRQQQQGAHRQQQQQQQQQHRRGRLPQTTHWHCACALLLQRSMPLSHVLKQTYAGGYNRGA